MSEIAIVLNTLNRNGGFILLHQSLGKIRCFLSYKDVNRLCVGSLVSCSLIKKRSYYIFEQVETDFVPLFSDQYDIFFIHNLLKICLEVPFEVPVNDVFSHMIAVYKQMHLFGDDKKNLSLLQLFFS